MSSRKSIKTPAGLAENASYNPSTPLFDTSSSDDDDYYSTYPPPKKRGRGMPKKPPMTDPFSMRIPRKTRKDIEAKPDDTETEAAGRDMPSKYPVNSHLEHKSQGSNEKIIESSNEPGDESKSKRSPIKHDEFLNARIRIISGKYTGLFGRIGRIISSGWMYIKGNDMVTTPVRWKDVEILSDEEEENEKWKDVEILGGDRCKKEGCHKQRQNKCEGYCARHFKALQLGKDLGVEIAKKEQDLDEHRSRCKNKGCKMLRQAKYNGYCEVHHEEMYEEEEEEEDDQSELSGEEIDSQEPDLIGATILVTDPSHAGLKGTITDKKSGLYLKVKWQVDPSVAPPSILPLEDVRVGSLSPDAALGDDPVKKYNKARVKKDGVLGKVERVIAAEWFFVSKVEKAFKRSEFVVLSYANEARPKDDTMALGSDNSDIEIRSIDHEDIPSNNPVIGVTVIVLTGSEQGKMGKVINVDKQGWWEVEGLAVRVKSGRVNFVNDGNLNLRALKEYFRRSKKRTKMPHVVKLDEIDNEKTVRPVDESSAADDTNPLLGVKVHVVRGKSSGHIGRITKICSGGWWEVEGLESRIQSAHVNLVDDGHLNTALIKEYYSHASRRSTMPKLVELDKLSEGAQTPGGDSDTDESTEDSKVSVSSNSENNRSAIGSSSSSSDDEADIMSRVAKRQVPRMIQRANSDGPLEINNASNKNICFKHKIASTDFGGPNTKARRLDEKESVMKWGRKPVTSLAMPSIPNLTVKKTSQIRPRRGGVKTPFLDPILVYPSSVYCRETKRDATNKPLLHLPEELRHLPSNTMVEIFNRRTGHVMRGDDAVSLSDLPAALMDHTEYEPIIPPPVGTK